ncbi:MAG TPA: DUF3568 family protein [Verrucomicrobia bacterium]|nr:DUF3568 family protein [Verrucomicrobiota bacterium]HOB31987.1 DUF3568 family protein [Verrucomicrobiota bacterium]HOP97570.1 DUF3568 family protein [Verrucomicrobiota bacterium]HPU55157.1 DUF3568 family protein [Verrucomicrobiota bacterium]
MKTGFFAALLGLALVAAGCVDTVSGRRTAGFPLVKDRIPSQYERPADEVYQAAREVIAYNGTLINESILHGQTNTLNNTVRTIEGKVNQRTVWVRIEQLEPRLTSTVVQVRTSGGGSDIELAAEIDKQIALRLVR